MFSKLLDILLPPLCISCRKEGSYICVNCRGNIREYNYFFCPECKKRAIDGRLDPSCRAACGLTCFFGAPLSHQDKAVKNLIHTFKYARVKDLAQPLSQILVEFLDRNAFRESVKKYAQKLALIPVPLFRFRERERGFNQSLEIARYISRHYQIPVLMGAIEKTKNTPPQADIKDKEKRGLNIQGVFACPNTALVRGKIAVLVDDVYTSGATMRECARVLREAGALQVWGVTAARG